MTLENLVPPLELCKQIPAGHFEDSALEWNTHGKKDGCGAELQIKCHDNRRYGTYYPAPTLAEIMLALDEAGYWCPTCYYQAGTWRMDCEDQTTMDAEDNYNPATAALKLWLELEAQK